MMASTARRKSKDLKLLLTETEFEDLKMAFNLIDRNQDGIVNITELQIMLQRLGIDISDDILQYLILNLSKTGNQQMDESDFLHFINEIDELQSKISSTSSSTNLDENNNTKNKNDEVVANLQAAFKIFDSTGKGYITRNELPQAMDILGEKLSDAELDRIWKIADVDKDGKLSYKDFAQVLLQ